jgi:hypothetical protein
MIFRVNSDYFLEQNSRVYLCNGEDFLCGRNWIFKYYLDEHRFQRLKKYLAGWFDYRLFSQLVQGS